MSQRDRGDAREAGQVAPGEDEKQAASRLWLVAACLCLFAAAALWLLDHADAAFVVAALGVVAWFFNVRAQLRQQHSRGDTEARGEDVDDDGGVE